MGYACENKRVGLEQNHCSKLSYHLKCTCRSTRLIVFPLCWDCMSLCTIKYCISLYKDFPVYGHLQRYRWFVSNTAWSGIYTYAKYTSTKMTCQHDQSFLTIMRKQKNAGSDGGLPVMSSNSILPPCLQTPPWICSLFQSLVSMPGSLYHLTLCSVSFLLSAADIFSL